MMGILVVIAVLGVLVICGPVIGSIFLRRKL